MKELLTPYATTKQIADTVNDLELRTSLIESLITLPEEEPEYNPSSDELEQLLGGLSNEQEVEQGEPAQRMARMLDESLEESIRTLKNIVQYSHVPNDVIAAARALADIYFTFASC